MTGQCPPGKEGAQMLPLRQDSETRGLGDSYSGDVPCQMMVNLKWQSQKPLSQLLCKEDNAPLHFTSLLEHQSEAMLI